MDYEKFFNRDPREVAQDLLGRLLIRRLESGILAAEITETGAYAGGADKTGPRRGMFYNPARLFLMEHRGHRLLNIATGGNGPTCVEIREIYGDKRIQGPGAIRNYFQIPEASDNHALGEETGVFISSEKYRELRIRRAEGNADNCKGVYSFG